MGATSRKSLMPVILGMDPANKVTKCGATEYFPKELNVTIEIPTYLPDGTKPGDPVPDDVGTKGVLAWLVFRTPESVDSFTNLLQQGKELVFGKEKL